MARVYEQVLQHISAQGVQIYLYQLCACVQCGQPTLTVLSTEPVAKTFIRLGSASAFPAVPFASGLTLSLAAVAGSSGAAPPIVARPQTIHVTKCPCASMVFVHRPLARSHTLMVLSSDADKRYFPDGWNTNARIQLSWPACLYQQARPDVYERL